MMRRFFVPLLSLVLALGGECLGMEVAAGLLADYQQQRKACGDEDELATLRLKARYTWLKVWTALETDDALHDKSEKELLVLRRKAYRLARARYEQGLASLRDVYETGAELFQMMRDNKKAQPSQEELRTMAQELIRTAKATGNKADVLKTEIVWYHNVTPVLSDIVPASQKKLRDISREQYQQGKISYWELAKAELNQMRINSEEEYAAYADRLYKEVEKLGVATDKNDYRITELLFRAREILVQHKKWLELSRQ